MGAERVYLQILPGSEVKCLHSIFLCRQAREDKACIVSSLKVNKLPQNVHIKGDQRPLEEHQTSLNQEQSQVGTWRWRVGVGRCIIIKYNTGDRKEIQCL